MMLGLDSSFNEANYGYQQFRTFLEAHADLVSIQEQGLQLYISLKKAVAGPTVSRLPKRRTGASAPATRRLRRPRRPTNQPSSSVSATAASSGK